jgi:hypothetical protein
VRFNTKTLTTIHGLALPITAVLGALVVMRVAFHDGLKQIMAGATNQ